MDAKLNLYDFLAYVIPGTLVTLLFYWLFTGFLAFSMPTNIGVPDALGAILFLCISYFLGHVVQAAGAKYQMSLEQEGGWFSAKMYPLADNNPRYTSHYKKSIKQSIDQFFSLGSAIAHDHAISALSNTDISPSSPVTEDQQQEMFYLCAALLHQEVSTNNSDVFRCICALYRSLHMIMPIGILISVLIALKQAVLFFLQTMNVVFPKSVFFTNNFFTFDGLQLFLGIFFVFFFIWSLIWIKGRWTQYTEYYVDSVYSNFYAWYCQKCSGQAANTQKQTPSISATESKQEVEPLSNVPQK
jgi:hypothetical protein